MTFESEKASKLQDIQNIEFGDSPTEIVSCLEILVMLIEIGDDDEVLMACKSRLQEGISKLKQLDIDAATELNIKPE